MIISVWQKSALPFVSQITCSVKNVSPKKIFKRWSVDRHWRILSRIFENSSIAKKGTPDTCMETTLWDLELILSWKWAKWVSTATCRAGKKVWKYKVRCDLVSFPDRTFKLLSDISCFFFSSISIVKKYRISRKSNFIKKSFLYWPKKISKNWPKSVQK